LIEEEEGEELVGGKRDGGKNRKRPPMQSKYKQLI
jgi:hypothetical protein